MFFLMFDLLKNFLAVINVVLIEKECIKTEQDLMILDTMSKDKTKTDTTKTDLIKMEGIVY